MFITRFTTISRETQEYYYHNAEDADKHLRLFLNDSSGLYRNISIIDEENNTVLCILPFVDGVPQSLIFHGSIVRIKPEWCSPGEEKYYFRVSNIDDIIMQTVEAIVNKLEISHSDDRYLDNSTMTMTVDELAETLGIAKIKAYELTNTSGFPSFKIGKRILVSRKGLQEWIKKQCDEQIKGQDYFT